MYKDILEKFPDINLVATIGGIRSVADLEALQEIGCAASLVGGKAFFEGEIPLTYFRVYSKT
ncbi:MAG: hypothetical protein R2792_08335 [Saprospiraceae bacterium]